MACKIIKTRPSKRKREWHCELRVSIPKISKKQELDIKAFLQQTEKQREAT